MAEEKYAKFQTTMDAKDVEEITTFLDDHGISKVDLIKRGYQGLQNDIKLIEESQLIEGEIGEVNCNKIKYENIINTKLTYKPLQKKGTYGLYANGAYLLSKTDVIENELPDTKEAILFDLLFKMVTSIEGFLQFLSEAPTEAKDILFGKLKDPSYAIKVETILEILKLFKKGTNYILKQSDSTYADMVYLYSDEQYNKIKVDTSNRSKLSQHFMAIGANSVHGWRKVLGAKHMINEIKYTVVNEVLPFVNYLDGEHRIINGVVPDDKSLPVAGELIIVSKDNFGF